MSERAVRVALAVAGVGLAAYGADRLLGLGWGNLVSTVVWLAGGVLLHDVVLAPLVVAGGWWAARRLTAPWRRFAATVLVLLGPLVLATVPTVGRFGAKADNVSLLDRPYAAGLAGYAALVLLLAAFTAGWHRKEVDRG